jgi:hypothetical protein
MTHHTRLPWRLQVSVVLTVTHLVVALLHVNPRLIYPQRAQTTKVVLALSQLGPVWVTWFGCAGLALVFTLKLNRGVHLAHMLGAASWLAYAFALEVGAWSSGGTHLLPVVTLALAATHTILAASYSKDVGRKETG